MNGTIRRVGQVHEAGHAVAAYAAGCRLRKVSCTLTSFDRPQNPEAWMLILAAGTAGIDLAGQRVPAGTSGGDRAAFDRAAQKHFPKEDADALWRRYRLQARLTLREYAPAFQAIAAALGERGTVSGEEATRLIEAATPTALRVKPKKARPVTRGQYAERPARAAVSPKRPPSARRAPPAPPPERIYSVLLTSGERHLVRARSKPRLGAGILDIGSERFNWSNIVGWREVDEL